MASLSAATSTIGRIVAAWAISILDFGFLCWSSPRATPLLLRCWAVFGLSAIMPAGATGLDSARPALLGCRDGRAFRIPQPLLVIAGSEAAVPATSARARTGRGGNRNGRPTRHPPRGRMPRARGANAYASEPAVIDSRYRIGIFRRRRQCPRLQHRPGRSMDG